MRKFWQRPSDIERLILLYEELDKAARLQTVADPKIAANDKDLALAALDTIKMQMTERIIAQAHRKADLLKKTKTTETKTTEMTGQ